MSATAKIDAVPGEGSARSWAPAALACMGVVFGDIGTSPLYTLNVAARSASPDGQVSPEAVLGIVSLIFWSLIIVISIKYAILIMRADNHGEGGILALLALVSPRRAKRNKWRAAMVVIGLVGATLLYGDGTITPAISVLSAIEGLKIYAPQMGRAVVPLTVAILVILFLIQRNGTSFIGGIFGPVMLIWFIVAGVLGVVGIVRTPAILTALSPLPAVTYFWHAGPLALVVIGGAFLAVTGGEAFYADMGHFGPIPIRIAWFGVALPALTLNYFGQGGLLLAEPNSPEVIDSPFYALAPQWSHYPLVVLATVATVIASQSIISGAYSMTQQAISLGFLPRMKVVHTEGREIGQIYVPFVNWALAAGTARGGTPSTARHSQRKVRATGVIPLLKRARNCCIAALRCCGAGSRPYMPSLGVSSLNSRPPQGGLLLAMTVRVRPTATRGPPLLILGSCPCKSWASRSTTA